MELLMPLFSHTDQILWVPMRIIGVPGEMRPYRLNATFSIFRKIDPTSH
jgi:hypothetical protein